MTYSARDMRAFRTQSESFAEKTYAGVLGKICGVYLGRALEGWSYEAIRKRFDEVDYYVSNQVGWPVIVSDDDVSGTFLFYRALEDNGFPKDISARAIGDTWLNYLVEDKTTLWWGGMGRSTEHTAYLRLKEGIHAPESGSAKLNSRAMAEAIGSEIFIDTWAMSNPGDPQRAAYMARHAASVAHDGIAVEAAVQLAAMEAQAFVESDISKLIDLGGTFSQSEELRRIVGDVREQCAKANDWRSVRQWLEENHPYRNYPGCCPMVPNHALLLASLILGGDDLQRSLMIAVSSGWDTDCNAGNLACLNGIRLGMKAFEEGPDYRGPVADRMYVVSADGGECMTDAVIETRRVLRAAASLQGRSHEPQSSRFAFEFPGSVQGWTVCPLHEGQQAIKAAGNINNWSEDSGLELRYEALARGSTGSVSVQTFIDAKPMAPYETSYFEVYGSPSVYETQTVRAKIRTLSDKVPDLRFFIVHFDGDANLVKVPGEVIHLKRGDNDLVWKVPAIGGLPIYRLGIELSSERRQSGSIALLEMDWSGAPEAFVMGGIFELSPNINTFGTSSIWIKSFVSSARHFRPDVDTTFSVSHPGLNGVATTGTRDWLDYTATSTMTMDLHKAAGLVARARGHRRYYAGIVEDQTAKLIKRRDETVTVLASAPFPYAEHSKLKFEVTAKGDALALAINGQTLVEARDGDYLSGGAGFFIEEGTVPSLGFEVRAI